jgi:hypothetical protein
MLSFIIRNEIHQKIFLSLISLIIGLDIKNWYTCMNLNEYIKEYDISSMYNCNNILLFKDNLKHYEEEINSVLKEFRKNRIKIPEKLINLHNKVIIQLINIIKVENIIETFSILIINNYSPHLNDAKRLNNIQINGKCYSSDDYDIEIGYIKFFLKEIFNFSFNEKTEINKEKLKRILEKFGNTAIYIPKKNNNEMIEKLEEYFNYYENKNKNEISSIFD